MLTHFRPSLHLSWLRSTSGRWAAPAPIFTMITNPAYLQHTRRHNGHSGRTSVVVHEQIHPAYLAYPTSRPCRPNRLPYHPSPSIGIRLHQRVQRASTSELRLHPLDKLAWQMVMSERREVISHSRHRPPRTSVLACNLIRRKEPKTGMKKNTETTRCIDSTRCWLESRNSLMTG